MVILFALFTLMFAETSNFVTLRRMVDNNNLTEFALKGTDNVKQFGIEET